MATQTRLFVHVPNEDQYGPFVCRKNTDVVECTRRILQSYDRERLIDSDVCFELPKIPNDLAYALLLVSVKDKRLRTVHAYVVEIKEDAVSLDEIRNFVNATYGPSSFDKDSLRPYEEDKDDQNSPEKSTGTITFLVMLRACMHARCVQTRCSL